MLLPLAGAVPGESRMLTLAELGTLELTVPVARCVGMGDTVNGQTPYLDVWVSADGQTWHQVFGSSAYFERDMAEPGPRRPHVYHVALDSFPPHVRVGTTGWYTGPVWVDGLEIIAPDGTVFRPSVVRAVNRADWPEAALLIDGEQAMMHHSVGPTEEETWQVDAVELDFDYPPGVEAQIRPLLYSIALPPVRWGVYGNPGGDSDPHDTPPGFVYWADPAAFAWYDFSILQGNVPDKTRRIKELNPDHRVMIRAWLGGAVLLDYVYDTAAREGIVRGVLDLIAPTPDLIHGVALSEEEPMYLFWGWYWSEPPAWLTKYRERYEEETGSPFVFQSEPLREWLKAKARFFYNDLYDRIKAAYPSVKVLPFMYVPEDISGWGWLDPAEIKADGWIYQWYDADLRDILKPCRHPVVEIAEIGARERWFNLALQRIRAAGVPMSEVYVQIWLYREQDDYRPQLEGVRVAGVENVFCFYFSGWIPPEPPQSSSPHDLAFRVYGPADTAWPGATHETQRTWLPVNEGRAQSFVAESNRVERVALMLAPPADPQAPLPAHIISLEGDGRAAPDGRPLATIRWTSDLMIPAEGWIECVLEAGLDAGATYWIAVRPDDGSFSPLRLGGTADGSFPGGECIAFESWGGYFNNWRTYDPGQVGNGSWPASYRERLVVEALITPPQLRIEAAEDRVRVLWNRGGTLESATALSGPWAGVQDAQSGVLIPASNVVQFFRVTR